MFLALAAISSMPLLDPPTLSPHPYLIQTRVPENAGDAEVSRTARANSHLIMLLLLFAGTEHWIWISSRSSWGSLSTFGSSWGGILSRRGFTEVRPFLPLLWVVLGEI